ncbi:MAG: hypothetical protein HC827_15110 [Cyanobacteria bacterium RM1_2_2]|nr:hypothetical protein [Cyanobacteria bacterium RM1_2_2]
MRFAFFALIPSLLSGVLLSGQVAVAQSEIRSGVLPISRFEDWATESDATLSTGVLADLETDPNFSGDFPLVYDTAANILDGYTIVTRGGYFPENAGVPREQQLSYAQAVYYFYLLPNRNGLILYRSPAENTSRYMIRRPGAGFLLP